MDAGNNYTAILNDINSKLDSLNTLNSNYYAESTSYSAIIANHIVNIENDVNMIVQLIIIIILLSLFKYIRSVIK